MAIVSAMDEPPNLETIQGERVEVDMVFPLKECSIKTLGRGDCKVKLGNHEFVQERTNETPEVLHVLRDNRKASPFSTNKI